MAAGADSIDDLFVIRSGRMNKVFGGVYAAATLGILLREVTHGHTRQLSTVLRRHLVALAAWTPLLDGIGDRVFIDIDSLLRPVYGPGPWSGVRRQQHPIPRHQSAPVPNRRRQPHVP
jgi:hypothetical protein